MRLLSLHHDVLVEMFHYLSTKDIFSLSAASKSIHEFARVHAIRVVVLDKPGQIPKFLAYILADGTNRLSKMNSLSIESSAFLCNMRTSLDVAWASQLLGVFQQATTLTRLAVSYVDALCSESPEIWDAIAALPHLTDLTLEIFTHLPLAFTSQIRGPLRRLTLGYVDMPDLRSDVHMRGSKREPLLQKLAPLAELETLRLRVFGGIMPASMVAPDGQLAGNFQWTSVRVLELTSHPFDVQFAPMSVFVHAFPNARVLFLHDWPGPVEVADHNEMCWSSLDLVKGYADSLRRWRIKCPVHHLDISWISNAPHIQEIVENTSPISLEFEMAGKQARRVFWTEFFTAAPRLRHLTIKLKSVRDKANAIDQVQAIAGDTSLVCLQVRFLDLEASVVEPAWQFKETTMKELGESLASNIPSLRYFAIAIGNEGAISSSPSKRVVNEGKYLWRRISETDGMSEQIERDTGERVSTFMQSPEYNPAMSFDEVSFVQPAAAPQRPVS